MGNNVQKLFLLGMPGSGKSTVAQEIEQFMKPQIDWRTSYFNDYSILSKMYKESSKTIFNSLLKRNKSSKRFSPTKYGEFIVNDFAVYDEALQQLERQVKEAEKPESGVNQLILIEFARWNYHHAFRVFEPKFFHNSSFLFLDVGINICMKRATQRVLKPKTSKSKNDYFVSETVFDLYRKSNNGVYLRSSSFKKTYQVSDKRIKIIKEPDVLRASILDEIQSFVQDVVYVPQTPFVTR